MTTYTFDSFGKNTVTDALVKELSMSTAEKLWECTLACCLTFSHNLICRSVVTGGGLEMPL